MNLNLGPTERALRIRYTYDDGGYPFNGVWWVAVSSVVPSGTEEDALLECFRDYYANVPEGQQERTRGYGPNWGDAWCDIPSDHLARHGFRLVETPIPDVEILIRHDDYVYDYSEEE